MVLLAQLSSSPEPAWYTTCRVRRTAINLQPLRQRSGRARRRGGKRSERQSKRMELVRPKLRRLVLSSMDLEFYQVSFNTDITSLVPKAAAVEAEEELPQVDETTVDSLSTEVYFSLPDCYNFWLIGRRIEALTRQNSKLRVTRPMGRKTTTRLSSCTAERFSANLTLSSIRIERPVIMLSANGIK